MRAVVRYFVLFDKQNSRWSKLKISALVFVHVDVSMNEENFLPRKICFDEEIFQEKSLCNL